MHAHIRFGGWTFDGSSTIAAGTSANVTCSNGGTPSVMTVVCPESTPINKTMDPEWWSTCGGGDSCKANKEIGDEVQCVAPSSGAATLGFGATLAAFFHFA